MAEKRSGSTSSAPFSPQREGRGIGLPAYGWLVWLGWIALMVLLVAPVTALFLFDDPSEGNAGETVAVGTWIFVLGGTAGYFEFVNKRVSRAAGLTQKSEGLTLAVAALGVGMFLDGIGGPPALALAFLAWRRIRKAGTPIAEGAATTAVAFFAGVVETLYLMLVLTGVLPWRWE
jgi:hypothetical protein